MSWSFSASGKGAHTQDSVESAAAAISSGLDEGQRGQLHAAVDAARMLCNGATLAEDLVSFSASGHRNTDGTGYVSLSLNTRKES